VDPVSGLDAVYAQTVPLASESLLLDVTRTAQGRLVAVGERGHILWSDDGEDWNQAEHVPTRSTLTTVTTAEGRLWAAGHDTVILTSGDGGATWTLEYFDPERLQPVMDIHFFNQREGMAIGAYGLMLVTDNGGKTWEDRMVSDEEWHLNAVTDLGGGHLVIAGEAGLSYRSLDRGETWEVIDMPYPGSMFGITRIGDCVLTFGLRGHAQESCDGGLSWVELDTGTQNTLNGASTGGGELLVVGNGGLLLRRGAGGFESRLHGSGVDFATAIALEPGRWLLVGEGGLHLHPEAADAAGAAE
jgi:photosystem II stability/assembly factor-like uncharacterized protein